MRFSLVAVFLVCAAVASADPQKDVEIIMRDFATPHGLSALKNGLKGPRVAAYGKALDTEGVRVVDPARFAEMVPNDIANPDVENSKRIFAKWLRHVFTAKQLSQLAALVESPVGEKIKRLAFEGIVLSESGEPMNYMLEPLLNVDALSSVLSKEEASELQMFFATDAGEALVDGIRRTLMIWGLASVAAGVRQPAPEISLRQPFIIEILNAEGVVECPNRIWCKDLIRRLQAEPASQADAEQPSEPEVRVGSFKRVPALKRSRP